MEQLGGRILVIEDDPEINELIGAYAQLAGFSYEPALNGAAGLEKAASLQPALIILDVMLPDIDGFEICRRLHRADGTREIPIVILTALTGEQYQRRGADCGAMAVLGKPFDPDQLIETMQKTARPRP